MHSLPRFIRGLSLIALLVGLTCPEVSAYLSHNGDAEAGTSVSINETPNQRTTTFGRQQIVEDFYDVGLRKGVSGANDARTETWQRGQLSTESFTAGPWSGWEVDRVQDSQGRLGQLVVKQGGTPQRTFSFNYDSYSQLSGSHGIIDAVYGTRDAAGRVTGVTRGSVSKSWSYNNGLLQSVGFTGTAGSFNFGFSYDSRRRITSRTATTGVSWNSMQYTGIGQLSQVLAVPARATLMTYGYDARGNRNSGSGYTQTTSTLDQVGSRSISNRGFGVMGSVNPAAQVAIQTSLQSTPQSLSVDPQTGSFTGWWSVPGNYNNGAMALLNVTVLGSLPGGGYQGATAFSESDLTVLIPPATESQGYDTTGRVNADAYWTYTWDSLGRLNGMVRKAGTSAIVGASGETLAFGYDCDGRRTTKTHTITYTNGTTKVETSQVLWSGWLPIAEQRSVNGTALPRRWFQWGADRSGTLEGAGGIGGLMAIQEEGGRTLLPVDDGLGNIIAVIDASTGQAVASYWYGPFGEPLGENGDMTACPFRFQTKWYDYECQHYYFGYRHYDPVQGRWLSRDPMGEEGGFNLYAYCGNDPVNRHDPLGLSTKLNIDGSVEFYDDPFNSHTELLQIMELLDQRNALAAQRAKVSQSSLRGYGGYTALIERQVGGLTDAIRSQDAEIKYRMTRDLTRNMEPSAKDDFVIKAYGNGAKQHGEYFRQEVLHGDEPPGPLFELGEATQAIEPHLAAFMGFLATLPAGGEGAALEFGSGEILAAEGRLSLNAFRSYR